jgi:hypothetical protein
MQLLQLPADNSTGFSGGFTSNLKGRPLALPVNQTGVRAGAYTAEMVNAENFHQTFKGINLDLPNGYNIMDATSRLSVMANNLLRIAQAWGWDITIPVGDHEYRIFQPAQHKWETTARDLGNNALSNSLISLVKGEFLSNLLLDGLVKSSYTSQPQAYSKDDDPWQRIQKIWHNTVRHPFRQAFGLSADPLTTIGHVLPPKERHWLAIKPHDTNIYRIKRFGDALSLKTTFDAIQEAILVSGHPSELLDNVRKAGTRQELKKLYVSLQPSNTIKPQVMDVLASLFDEKTGELKKNAYELAPKVAADLDYYLTLYKPCGGQCASEEGIRQLLSQMLATEPITHISDEGVLALKPPKETAMSQAHDWFKTINAHWKKDADQAVRLSTQIILGEFVKLYEQEHQKAILAGNTTICKQTLAKRFALEVAPKLLSKTGNTYNGELAAVLEPAFQMSQRTALLNEYETHRNMALLSQTITQALFTCFVLGNLLFFIVFNTLARLDVDFKGPHGETRLDFGEMKRSLTRWIKKQLGQEVEEPKARVIQPKVSLDLSLGNTVSFREEQQVFNKLKPQAVGGIPTEIATVGIEKPLAEASVGLNAYNYTYLKQSMVLTNPDLPSQDMLPINPLIAGGGVSQ